MGSNIVGVRKAMHGRALDTRRFHWDFRWGMNNLGYSLPLADDGEGRHSKKRRMILVYGQHGRRRSSNRDQMHVIDSTCGVAS